MVHLLKTPVGRFRIIGFLEGISFLILLGIAMPLKYIFDFPIAVTIVGSIHGGLFTLYVLAVLYMMIAIRWRFSHAFLAMVASVIPFGPFILDARLLRHQT
jgi:integral membrane protein